ncbi:MAG: hypothetical protein ACKVOP_07360 [Sphingomonadaceae bacterium]
MSNVAGAWKCLVKSPLGEQESVLTVNDNGDGTWTGTNAGAMGALDCNNGKIDGNTLTWTMDMKVPMPMTLECDATIDGDTLTGGVKAGMFGTSPMTGTRT